MLLSASLRVAGPPLAPDREAAREAARRELAKPMYAEDDPSLLERGVIWLLERLADLLDRAVAASPGGWAGLLGLLLVVVLAALAIRLRVGPTGRAASSGARLFVGGVRSAADHRSAAERAEARGEWAEAVRERLRAVVRGLEERGLLDPRPGRTADEAAADAALLLPDYEKDLRSAARSFDEVWYGGASATPAAAARVRALDGALRTARSRLSTGAPR